MNRAKPVLLIGALAASASAGLSLGLGWPFANSVLVAGAAGALACQHFERSYWPIAIFWSLGALGLLAAGREIDGYMLHVRRVPLPHPYPWAGVLTLLGVQAVEVGLLALLLRPPSYSASWVRALLAALTMLGLAVFFGLGLMHAPPYMGFHWLWVLSGFLACLLLLGLAMFHLRRQRAA